MKDHMKTELLRFFPAGAGAGVSAWTLNQWVMLVTLLYVLFQFLYLGRKWWREEQEWKRNHPGQTREAVRQATAATLAAADSLPETNFPT